MVVHNLRRRAFTLVELLVVIGIIALLISILLPVLSKVRRQAEKINCASSMKQIMTACRMYCDENKGDMPNLAPSGDTDPQSDDDIIYWQYLPTPRDFNQSAIAPYLKVKGEALQKVWRCPGDVTVMERKNRPGLASHGDYHYSYSIIQAMRDRSRKLYKVWRPSVKGIIFEEYEANLNDPYCCITPTNGDDFLANRHGGYSNVAYADGHVDVVEAVWARNQYDIYTPFRTFDNPDANGNVQEFNAAGQPMGARGKPSLP